MGFKYVWPVPIVNNKVETSETDKTVEKNEID